MAGTQARQFDQGQLERTKLYRAATTWMLENYNSLETDQAFAFLYRLDQRRVSLGIQREIGEIGKALLSGRQPRLDDGLVQAALEASDKALRAHTALLEKQGLARDETVEAIKALLPDDTAGRKILFALYDSDISTLMLFVGPRNPLAILTGAGREDIDRLRGQGLIDGTGMTQRARDLLDFRQVPHQPAAAKEARGAKSMVYDWDACTRYYEERNAAMAKERGELAYLGQLRGVFRLVTQNPGLPIYRFFPPSYLMPRNLLGYPLQYSDGMARSMTLDDAVETVREVRELQRGVRKNIEPDSAAQWAVAVKYYQRGELGTLKF